MKNKLEKYRQIPEFSEIINKMTEEEIEQSFSSSLSFGTSGVRGIIGIGTNKMNILNVIKIVSATSLYLKSIGKENVGISYDTRKNSKLFAEYSFYTLKHFGLKPKIFKDPTPTPVLSFALKKYFDLGINITASHNPSDYNGIKVMSEMGSQINESVSTPIAEFMDSIDEFEVYKNLKKRELDFIDDSVKQEYLDFCLKEVSSYSKPKISVLYTNLCGVGRDYVKYVLEKRNFKVNFVESQFEYDENFTTCPSPNPEFEIAFNEAKKQATGEDLIFATDPDGDRLGAMVKNREGYRLLSGNEIGKILTYFLLTEKKIDGEKFITTTVVTSRAIKKLARKFNAYYYETLTGFKNIASKVEEESKNKTSLIFFEESCGYEVTGLLRDKDGITAGLLLVEIANFYAHQNK
ncbi:MAG: hypothetical protein IKA31_00520, partial [Clostridia bacterium]|nr:hypothetical protein [Clostridia bacterium]